MASQNLKEKLKAICQEGSGEETRGCECFESWEEYEEYLEEKKEADKPWNGRFFIGDDELREFAKDHDLVVYEEQDEEDRADWDMEWPKTIKAVARACNCRIVFEYAGANENRQFGDQEVIFKVAIALYAVGKKLYDNKDHCGCCSDTSSYNNLKCYIRQTFDKTPTTEELYMAVTGDGTRSQASFKKIVWLVKSKNFEQDLDPNDFYYFTQLTDKQAAWVKKKTELDYINISEWID